MDSTVRTPARRSRLRPLVVAAVIVTALAVAGGETIPIDRQSAAGGPATPGSALRSGHRSCSDDPTSRPRSAIPGFVVDRGRYTRFDVPGVGDETAPASVNNRGVIVGSYYDPSGATHGFQRDERCRFTTIEIPGAMGEGLSRINDRGQIVGRYSTNTAAVQDPDSQFRGFLLDRGRVVRLDPRGAVLSQAVGLNNRGQVVGEYLDRAGRYHGYVWHRGRFTIIDKPGATATSLIDINDRGHMLGVYVDAAGRFRGFVLRNGRYSTFDVPDAAYLFPRDINNRGQIVGFTLDDLDLTGAQGFLLADGPTGPVTRIDVPDAPRNLVFGFNDRGQIVGNYENTTAGGPPSPEWAARQGVAV